MEMVMKRIFVWFVFAVIISGYLYSASGRPIKVGFLYIGPVGESGWTYAHDQGRRLLEKITGVKTIYKENVSETPECVNVVREMIKQGCNVIAATSFGYMNYLLQIAGEYPEVTFLNCSGYKTAANMGNYNGRMYQAAYLAGIVAGFKTMSNRIGIIAGYKIASSVRLVNSFALGVRSVKPAARVSVNWTWSWYDPVRERDAAVALLNKGADVLYHTLETDGPLGPVMRKGAALIGNNSAQAMKASQNYLTATVWNWGAYYINQIKQMRSGKWQPAAYWGGLKEEVVKLAPLFKNVPEAAKRRVAIARKKLISGRLQVFAGPLKDQNGELKVKAGEQLSEKGVQNMLWLIQGVEELP